MRLVSIVLLLTILECISATCVSLGGVCYGSSWNEMSYLTNRAKLYAVQYQLAWKAEL